MGSATNLVGAKPWRTRRVALFFLAYCIADLATGALDYIDEIDYQSGWAHHSFYRDRVMCVTV